MIKSCAEKLTNFLISENQIDNNDYDMYIYAYETLISFFVNIGTILIVGYICNKFIYTVIFLLFYCPIRQFTGGYHADNYSRCLLSFLLLYLINIYAIEILIYYKLIDLIVMIIFISYIGIWILAPIEHRNNPLTYSEKNRYKNIARVLVSILLILFLVGIKFDILCKYAIYLGSVIICAFMMLILGKIKNKGIL